MSLRRLKERFKRLEGTPLQPLVWIAASIQQTIKDRAPVLVRRDADGDWKNRRRDATFFCPRLHVASLRQVDAETRDYFCREYLPARGDVVVDIGAGIGDNALVFSRMVGPTGRVVAIEAHPGTYRCLLKTVRANRLSNVVPLHLAISDEAGEVRISDGPDFLSNAIGASAGVLVPARRLDDVMQEIGLARCDLLKMNIEGAELAALRGMPATLRVTRHVAVSAHDFKADRGEGESFRTHAGVSELLREATFDLSGRPADGRAEIPYYVYGRNRLIS